MKKFLSIMLSLALILSVFCMPSLAEEDPVVLTVAVADKTNVEDFNTNAYTLYLEETLGVDLVIQTYESSDYSSKINLMFQSGDKLEDIILAALATRWSSAGPSRAPFFP